MKRRTADGRRFTQITDADLGSFFRVHSLPVAPHLADVDASEVVPFLRLLCLFAAIPNIHVHLRLDLLFLSSHPFAACPP
jgi:hypothetical protein